MSHVFDAPAVLALLNEERGATKAAALAAGSWLSAVNAVEVQQKLIDAGMDAEEAHETLGSIGLAIEAFDSGQAAIAASLRPLARKHKLSLADCACIALARTLDRPVLLGDHAWTELSEAAGFSFDDLRS